MNAAAYFDAPRAAELRAMRERAQLGGLQVLRLARGERLAEVDALAGRRPPGRGTLSAVLDADGAMLACVSLHVIGEVALLNEVGARDDALEAGALDLLISEVVCEVAGRRRRTGLPVWVTFGLLWGPDAGHVALKRRLGFAGRRVRWSWIDEQPPTEAGSGWGAPAERIAAEALPYLEGSGWIASRRAGRPVDRHGRPVPWYTYAAIDLLTERVHPDMSVFEYGTGNSTLWWAARAGRVTVVEHDAAWVQRMRSRVPVNVALSHVPLAEDGAYARAATASGAAFHVVVIDGRDRVNCARRCLGALREDGVIVWDNTNRTRYAPGFAFLAEHGFRRLNLRGPGPVNTSPWATSVFYRPGNCLGI